MRHHTPSSSLASAFTLVLLAALAAEPRAQVVWNQLATATSPSPRCCTGMAYDMARSRAVIFGGFVPGVGFSDETWEWDGTGWAQRTSRFTPFPRDTHGLAYDSGRARTVMFGGGSKTIYAETWEWDGTLWRLREVATAPSARLGPAMAYDPQRARMVLFGGLDATQQLLGDTWEWDGLQWRQLFPANSPSARSLHAMVFDPERGRVVLFGGGNPLTQVYHGDTWEWDGTDWAQVVTLPGPPARLRHTLAWDAVRERAVLFGGHDAAGSFSDTWEWSRDGWIERVLPTPPPQRRTHGMAFDAARGRMVLFGGQTAAGFSADTWEYFTTAPANYTSFGTGCAGSGGPPTLRQVNGSLPWISETLHLEVTAVPRTNLVLGLLGVSSTSWGLVPLPLQLGVIGAPGCSLYTSIDASFLLEGSQGTAAWRLPIPRLLTLVGRSLFLQALVIEPDVPIGFVVSDAGEAVLGAK